MSPTSGSTAGGAAALPPDDGTDSPFLSMELLDEDGADRDALPEDEDPADSEPPAPTSVDDQPARKSGGRRKKASKKSMDELPPLSPEVDMTQFEYEHLTMNTINTQSVVKWFHQKRADDVDVSKLDPVVIEYEVMSLANRYIHEANKHRLEEEDELDPLKKLTFAQVAEILMQRHHIRRIALAGMTADRSYDVIGVYATEGENEGIYLTDDDALRAIARQYNPSMTMMEFREVISVLMDRVPRCTRCEEPDTIAVGNGLFDFRTKVLHPFTPAKVFTSKSHVNWNPDATNVVIHNDEDGTDWDVESWMTDFGRDNDTGAVDEGYVNLLWQFHGAVLRPNVPWNMCAWFVAETGNNGKGTLVHLERNLVGPNAYASISLDAFSKDFLLEPLVDSQCILVDENDVGVFVDKAANFKACVTGDTIMINRKHKSPVAYQFRGFMVQCVNEKPQTRDKSESLYRRLLLVPFTKTFTGKERKYIKEDYLNRTEVLEYVLKRVLMMDYYSFDIPQACLDFMETYKETNDPIREFWNEFRGEFVWDLLPFDFCYELYTKWMKTNNPSGFCARKSRFVDDLTQIVLADPEWTVNMETTGKRASQSRSTPAMNHHESLVDSWMMGGAWLLPTANKDQKQRLKSHYRGITRLPGSPRPLGLGDPSTYED